MQFRTQIPILKSDRPIDYYSKVVSLGSCFAVNISEKFEYYKFNNSVNPYGILFHPPAIEKAIDFALSGKVFSEKDLFFHNGQWQSFDIHSEWSHPEQSKLLSNLNSITQATNYRITEATHLILTLGTAWVYRNIASNEIVANCHKVPQKEFTKELLSVAEIEQNIRNISSKIQSVNPMCNIIFTISPVRHTKDGFAENQRSKAHLIAAVHNVLSENNNHISYFPSYEIMMDELRDYRFYAEDMLHPNQIAIDYIWQRFSETIIAEKDCAIMAEVAAIQKGLAHRPFNLQSKSHLHFLENLNRKICRLQDKFPHLKFY
jgi:hypothetical protein